MHKYKITEAIVILFHASQTFPTQDTLLYLAEFVEWRTVLLSRHIHTYIIYACAHDTYTNTYMHYVISLKLNRHKYQRCKEMGKCVWLSVYAKWKYLQNFDKHHSLQVNKAVETVMSFVALSTIHIPYMHVHLYVHMCVHMYVVGTI